jgi:hypothetical protein
MGFKLCFVFVASSEAIILYRFSGLRQKTAKNF